MFSSLLPCLNPRELFKATPILNPFFLDIGFRISFISICFWESHIIGFLVDFKLSLVILYSSLKVVLSLLLGK